MCPHPAVLEVSVEEAAVPTAGTKRSHSAQSQTPVSSLWSLWVSMVEVVGEISDPLAVNLCEAVAVADHSVYKKTDAAHAY